MSYAVRTDVENVYGKSNIAKWADIDNTNDDTAIAERITWAIDQSYALMNDRLRNGRYEVPFEDPAPSTIVYINALWAGMMLFDSRMVVDGKQDQLSFKRLELQTLMRQIHRGQLIFEDVDFVGESTPRALIASEEETDDTETICDECD